MFKLGISIPSLETRVPGDRSHPYRKNRWRLHFIFVVIQVEREIVMTIGNYLIQFIHVDIYEFIVIIYIILKKKLTHRKKKKRWDPERGKPQLSRWVESQHQQQWRMVIFKAKLLLFILFFKYRGFSFKMLRCDFHWLG